MAFPLNPVNNQIATVNNVTYTYNSSVGSWTRSNSNWAGITYAANTAPPTAGLTAGSQWYDTSTDTLFSYEFDGISSYWVDISTPYFSSNAYANVYASVSGNSYVFANLVPATTGAYSIGTSGNAYTSVYTGNLIISNGISWANGAPWLSGGAGGGGSGITYTAGTTAPVFNLSLGSQWYNTLTDILYEYQYDGRSFFWVDVSTPSFAASNIAASVVTTLVVAGNTTVGGNLVVAAASSLGNTTISGTAIITGATTVSNNFTVTGSTTVTNITISGTTTAPNLTISGNATTGNITTGILTSTNFTTSNISAGNISAGNISAGNVTVSGALVTGSLSTIDINSSGNVYANAAIGGAVSSTNLGFMGMPQNVQSAGYTATLSDQGKHIYISANSTITIPANSVTAFPVGAVLTFVTAGPNVVANISINSDTMYFMANGVTGSRYLGQYGMASAVKVASTAWYINGAGLT